MLGRLGRISPTRRPQVKDVNGLRDLVRNEIYVRLLREGARRQDLAHRPRVAAQLADRADFLDLQRFVTRNVYDKVPVDSTTLRRQFEAKRASYRAPARAVVVQTVFDTQVEADTLAARSDRARLCGIAGDSIGEGRHSLPGHAGRDRGPRAVRAHAPWRRGRCAWPRLGARRAGACSR